MKEKQGSFIYKHLALRHRELIEEIKANKVQVDITKDLFTFAITGCYRDPLTRQLTEMIRIRTALDKGSIGGEKGIKFKQKIYECINSRDESFLPFLRKRHRNGPTAEFLNEGKLEKR